GGVLYDLDFVVADAQVEFEQVRFFRIFPANQDSHGCWSLDLGSRSGPTQLHDRVMRRRSTRRPPRRARAGAGGGGPGGGALAGTHFFWAAALQSPSIS